MSRIGSPQRVPSAMLARRIGFCPEALERRGVIRARRVVVKPSGGVATQMRLHDIEESKFVLYIGPHSVRSVPQKWPVRHVDILLVFPINDMYCGLGLAAGAFDVESIHYAEICSEAGHKHHRRAGRHSL